MKRKKIMKIIKKIDEAAVVVRDHLVGLGGDSYEPVICGGEPTAAYYDGYDDALSDVVDLLLGNVKEINVLGPGE